MFLMRVLYSIVPGREKIRKLKNFEKHQCSDDLACRDSQHSGYKWSESANSDFLANNSEVIRQCKSCLACTRTEEIFQHMKAKFCEKGLSLEASALLRLVSAIILHFQMDR
jgi:hypothetical protein